MSEAFQDVIPLHGGQLRQIALRYGIPMDRLLDFSANINPEGPPASALQAMRRALADPATLETYPDLELSELKDTIANHIGVGSENIVVANGFVPLLDAALRSLKIQRCLLPLPCFNEYRRVIENAGATVVPHRLMQARSFAYEPESILEELLAGDCDAILLANPQNPSGVLCAAERLKSLVKVVTGHEIKVFLDEAFIDYCPKESLSAYAIGRSNLFVFRSVTKFFAIPGLRVAYAICNALGTKQMDRYIAPWPITTLASDAVCAALCDEAYAETSKSENERRRSWLIQKLGQLGIDIYPSSTNFLLLRFPAEVDVAHLWEKMIVDQQIVLRSCTNFGDLAPGHLRIAVRSISDNERLIQGLQQTLNSSHRRRF